MWPDFAHLFGLYPDDIGRFSKAEWMRYLKFRNDWVKAQTRG